MGAAWIGICSNLNRRLEPKFSAGLPSLYSESPKPHLLQKWALIIINNSFRIYVDLLVRNADMLLLESIVFRHLRQSNDHRDVTGRI